MRKPVDVGPAVAGAQGPTHAVPCQPTPSGLRHVARTHPYGDAGGSEISLRGSIDLVAAELAGEVAERVSLAGVEVVEVWISHRPTPRRSPRRCCAGSRRTRWWQPAA